MDLRFCPRCRADVEDVGGFCLLGHRFPEVTADAIADLRAEVDQAFAKVQVEVATVLGTGKTPGPPATAATPDPSPPREASPGDDVPLWQQLRGDDREVDEVADEIRATSKKIYEELSVEDPVSQGDPIIAFSPSPRADWGPEKGHGKRSKR